MTDAKFLFLENKPVIPINVKLKIKTLNILKINIIF